MDNYMNGTRPTFSDFFKSYYYSNTFLAPVDTSVRGLSKHILNDETATTAQNLISQEGVQEILSAPLTYTDENKIEENNNALKEKGFELLSKKSGKEFYSVLKHESLPGRIIKSGAARTEEGKFCIGPTNDRNEMAIFTKEESILRIEMADRIRKIARENNINVVVPEKKLVEYANSENTLDPTRKYCVICEEVEILSRDETLKNIENMDEQGQRKIAKDICTIIKKAGLVDANLDNIRLNKEGQLVFLDTEPAGLMVAKKRGFLNCIFQKGASVEKCARIGLSTLSKNCLDRMQEVVSGQSFANEVNRELEALSQPKLSKCKIVLSIFTVGLLPLIYAIAAYAKTRFTARIAQKIQENHNDINKLHPLLFQFYKQVEGVPFDRVASFINQEESVYNDDLKDLAWKANDTGQHKNKLPPTRSKKN